MMSRIIRERTQNQLNNDKRLSEFFKKYHAKIKEINKKEIFEKVENIQKVPKKKKEKISKKHDVPIIKIERCKHNIII